MRCAKCGSDNRGSRKFCTNCGTSLVAACPKCGAPVQPGEKFCGNCGAPIGESEPSAASSSEQGPLRLSEAIPATEVIEGERETVAALFADLKGSTELMESLDPEETLAIIDPALKIMVAAVSRYEGYVVQSTGDGIFALFGAVETQLAGLEARVTILMWVVGISVALTGVALAKPLALH